ncbi:MAG: TolC family protein [Bdellovibrionota bacterium]
MTMTLLISLIFAAQVYADLAPQRILELPLHEAESRALATSNPLKASISDQEAASEHAGAQLTLMLPKLSAQASYQYNTNVPTFNIGSSPSPIPFGQHDVYSAGGTLSYTLWDTLSSYKAYKSAAVSSAARTEDRKNTELQTLLGVRASYVQVQLDLEELVLINGSRELARAQNHDIETRFRAGAASHLDVVTSQRSVLSYELQFQQRQTELAAALKDLLAQIGYPPGDYSSALAHPGPPNVENVSLVLKLDPLERLLVDQSRGDIPPPNDHHPQIQSAAMQAEAFDFNASSIKAKVFPTIQVSAQSVWNQLNAPVGPFNENSFGVSLSAPLWLGDPSWHLADEQLMLSESARHREDQIRINIDRDFAKARETLDSLRSQKTLAARDVAQSEEAARLYYSSYKAGKNNLIDVQAANNQALVAKVNAARIDAQILNQLITLKALSGQELRHE